LNRLCIAGALVALIALAGCKSSGTAYNPPSGISSLGIHHMYLSDDSSHIYMYDLPLTSSSTPVVTLTVASGPAELFVDAQGRLFVPLNGVTSALAYKLPLTASSTPAFTLTTSQGRPEDATEDSSGNVYVSDTDAGGYIDIYNHPVNANASPSATMTNNGVGNSGLKYPYGISIGPNGDLYASDDDDINQFTPPFSASSAPSASASPNTDNYGLVTDPNNRVLVANASANGYVSVYMQPFTNASTPAFNIDVSATYLDGMAFDGSGNLWTIDAGGVIWEIKTPITSSSTATQVLTGTSGYGIAFGP
jgi:streptogramin lyase